MLRARRVRVGLSEAERLLWQAFVASVRPLRAAPPAAAPALPAPAPAPPAAPPASSPAPPALVAPRATPPRALAVGEVPAGVEAARWRDLRRGRTRPERTLDLHGRTAAAAHGAVRDFLHAARADGMRCVAIVTGKGPGEGGVLRRELPHWLNAPDLRPLLLAAAHPHALNQGAVHLLLRRARARAGGPGRP